MTARVLGLAAAVLLAGAAPAAASIDVDGFSVTASSLQAGGHPNLVVDLAVDPSGTDDLRSVALNLAPGVVAAPAAAISCDADELDNGCPGIEPVGEGDVTATASFFGFPITATSPADVYLVEPQAGEAARLGVVAHTPIGDAVLEASATLRREPDVGMTITFPAVPRSVNGTAVRIEQVVLTIFGTVEGVPFTYLPTGCALATSSVAVTSYDDATPKTAASAFTPTGCGSLGFAPSLSGAVAVAADGSAELVTHVDQRIGDTTLSRLALRLPAALGIRGSALGRACDAPDPATCPASATVGDATATSPLLGQPVPGRVVLAGDGQALPELVAVFSAPVPLLIRGASGLAVAGGLAATFEDLPDLPLSRLTVRLAGGAESVLLATSALCSAEQRVEADVRGHSDAESTISSVLAVTGCQPSAPPPADTIATPAAPPVAAPVAAELGVLSARGIRTTLRVTRRRGLRLTVQIPASMRAARTLDLALPRGLALDTRRLRRVHVFAGGRGRRVTAATRHGLRASVPTGARTWTIAIERGALRGSARRVGVTLRDGRGAPVVLRVRTL